LGAYVDKEGELPIDQHALLAAVMPRDLLVTCGVDDLWANPDGTAQAALAAREVARFVGRPEAVAMRVSPGGHSHGPEVWAELLRLVSRLWLGSGSGVDAGTGTTANGGVGGTGGAVDRGTSGGPRSGTLLATHAKPTWRDATEDLQPGFAWRAPVV
jgi:hypothetical protein